MSEADTVPRDKLIPSGDTIFAWIEEVFAQGVRRPGYPADGWAEQFCLQRFQAFGLENVRLEPVQLPYWEPRSCSLPVAADGPGAVQMLDLPCFPLPHSAATDGLEAQLVPFDAAAPQQAKGCIALCDAPLVRSRHASLARLATWSYDPADSFADSVQVLPFSSRVMAVMEPAMAAGPAGFVGVLPDYPSDSHDYYVPYDGLERQIPGVWISGS